MQTRKAPVFFRLLLLLPLLSQLPLHLAGQPLFPVKKNKKWGLMSTEGKIVVPATYDAIGEFKQFGYAVMQRNGKVGMLDAKGREVLPPRFGDLKALDSTLISVLEKDQWKVINLQEQVILKPGYERVEVLAVGSWRLAVGKDQPPTPNRQLPTANSFLAFQVDKKWGIVDAAGRQIAAPKYEEVALFKNMPEEMRGVYFQTEQDGKFGLLLPTGSEILPPQADEIRAQNANLFFIKKDRKWGAVDAAGRQVLKPGFDHFGKLSEKFLRLALDGKAFLFSLESNSLITNGEYEAYYPFSDNYVLCKRQRLMGLLDKSGNLVLANRYHEIQPYDNDLFRVNLDGNWGIVTLGDQEIIPFGYDYISPMKHGLCVVIKNKRLGIANFRGELVVQPEFDRIELFERQAKAWRKEILTRYEFNEDTRIASENSFPKHFTIRVGSENIGQNQPWSEDANPFLLEKFEWFYSPRQDQWGLRRLDNGAVQIEPSFHEVRVEKELGLTLVGIEMYQEMEFDRTAFRFEMAYGVVQNDTGLLVHEVDLLDLRLSDFDHGLPVARCIFLDGRHGLINRIGKVIRKDLAFVGDFSNGLARTSLKGRLSAQLAVGSSQLAVGSPTQSPITGHQSPNYLGGLQPFLTAHLAPVTLSDYTQHDLDLEKSGWLTCPDCEWGYVDTAGQMVVSPQYSFARDFVNQVGIVQREGKWGMVDGKGKELLPCRYDELGFLENTGNRVLRIFKKEEKYGLIDTLGRLAVNVKYEDIGSFSEGRLAVKRNGNWGFVDRNGREVVPCRFAEVNRFCEGVAAVKLGSKWGFIDKNGNVELDFHFTKAGNFNNGLAPAKNEAPHFGYVNRKGEWVIQPRFPKANDFDRGVARVEITEGEHLRTGLIDAAGNYVTKPRFISLTAFNEHGLAVAEIGGSPVKYGLLNLQGELVNSLAFREIAPFREGLARVQHRDDYGFVNTKGELVIPARFSKASDFSEGKAAVWLEGQCGFIDTTGKLVIEPKFSRCMDFREGKAIVFRGNQRAGLIDAKGNFIIEPGINRLLDFAEGRGLVRDEHYQFYYITEQNRFYEGFYEKAGQFRHGVAVVQVEGRWAIINQQGIEIIPPKYDRIEQFENGFAKVRIKGFSGLTNLQGELIVQPDYEYISYAGEGLFRVEQGDKVGYFDMEGRWVWGLQE